MRYKAILAASESKLQEMISDVHVAQAEYDRRFMKAPANGTILQLDAKEGGLVSTNTTFADFAPEGPVTGAMRLKF